MKTRAVHLLIKPENIAAVRRVADELLIRETLDGDVVQVLIEVSDGFATEADLERYLLMRSG